MDGTRRADDRLPLTNQAHRVAAAFLAAALTGPMAAAHGAGTHWARLDDLLRQARLVVAGTVTRVVPFDDGRLVVAWLRPERIIKGTPAAGDVAVVEELDLPSARSLLPAGQHALVFLARAPHASSRARVLPPGPSYQVAVNGRMGVLASPSAEAIREAGAIVERLARAAADTTSDFATRAATARALAFDELAAAHPVVVEDGTAAAGALPDLAPSLTDTEHHHVEAALQRHDLPPRVRAAVVRLVGNQRLVGLAPVLRRLDRPAPEVLAASWQALRALDQPPSGADLAPLARSRDAAVRAVVAPALLEAGGARALPTVERLALRDPDPAVRKAATEALGASKLPGALRVIERVFADSPAEVRRVAGMALVAWGGDDAAAALGRLVFTAPPDAQRWASVLLLSLGRPKDDPLLERIRTTHPDATVRDVVEHGVDLDTHHHD